MSNRKPDGNDIAAGDRVRHRNRVINGGLDMPVEEISDSKALCIYLDLEDNKFKDQWFDLADLELVSKPGGKR